MTGVPTVHDQVRMSWSSKRDAAARLAALANDLSPEGVYKLASLYFERLSTDPPLAIKRRQALLLSPAYDTKSVVREQVCA